MSKAVKKPEVKALVRAEVSVNNADRHFVKKQYGLMKGLYNFIFEDLSSEKCRYLYVYFCAISVFEVLTYTFHGIFSVVASRLWLIGGLLCFSFIIAYTAEAVLADLRERKLLSVISLLAIISFLLYAAGSLYLSEINPDAAQQAAAGLSSFQSRDLNYTGKAFLGYPNRQYIITAIPALLFGRNIVTLHLGFALPFLAGIFILYSALRKWAFRLGIDTELAVLPVYALFTFPFAAEYYANFEQAIYPITYTMIAAGFFLLLLCKPSIANMMGLAWTGCILSNCYTPALATLGLLVVFLGLTIYLLIVKPGEMPFMPKHPALTAKLLMFVEGNILIFFIATLLNKRQDRITELRGTSNLIMTSVVSIFNFLTDRNASFLGMFGILFIIYLFAGLTLRLKRSDFLIALWVLGVFAASSLLAGYTTYQPAWIMQRALIVLPVVLIGISLSLFHLLREKQLGIKRGMIVIMLAAFAFTGLYNFNQVSRSFTYFNYVQPMKYLISDLEDTARAKDLNSMSEFNLVVYTDNLLFKNPADYCRFFFPRAHVYTPDPGQLPEGIDLSKATFIYGDGELSNTLELTSDSIITRMDQRHDQTITWYKGSIIK